MKILAYISRLLVGALFIVSGLIKANDPLGFSYKLEEYFEVFGMEWLSGLALTIAIGICVMEIAVGAATLLAVRMRFVAWVLLGLIGFFTFLTFYSAYFNKVTDCGCFGDALKLTPWESFTKDVVLLAFVLVIFAYRKNMKQDTVAGDIMTTVIGVLLIAVFCLGVLHNPWSYPIWYTLVTMGILIGLDLLLGQKRSDAVVLGGSTLFALVFSVYIIRHLPIKDFRPYALGVNMREAMLGVPPVLSFQYRLKDKQTDEEKLFDQFPANWDQNYEYVDAVTTVVKEGVDPKIHDFVITNEDGEDITEEVLNNPGYTVAVVAYDLSATDRGCQEKLNTFMMEAEKAGATVMGWTASVDEVRDFRVEVQAMYPYYIMDGTVLKTIIRANPGILLIKDGVIKAKWHYRDLPDFSSVQADLMKD
ncbi:MAG: DoxX family protein [Flavobacteriales bacterium]|nr:DoxX family protein [Flavobacteriales bacterium]MCB9447794.1 DoxX family protein [Flavobacteriales bacterium]